MIDFVYLSEIPHLGLKTTIMGFIAFFNRKNISAWKKRKGDGKKILLHGNFATLFTFQSATRTVPLAGFQQLIPDSERPLFLLAAPFTFTYIQQTIHLKKSELIHADNQTLGFSRFPKENRMLESLHIDGEHALTAYTHLSDQGNRTLDQLKSKNLKVRWQPAVPYFIQQFIQHPLIDSHSSINLLMDQEVLQLGWKEKRMVAHHLFYWPQNDDKSRIKERAEQLIDSKFPATSLIPIHITDNIPKNSQADKIVQSLFFPPDKPKPVKAIRKQIRDNRLLILKRIPLKYLLMAATVLVIVWTAHVKLKLYNLCTDRTELMNTVSSLELSTAGLEEIAKKERLLIKITALAQAVQSTSWEPLSIIKKIEAILPKTAWIQTLKINRNSIQLQLLDAGNSNITETIKLLMENFGDVRLDDNSILQLETHSLRKRTFTINQNTLNDTK